MRFTQCAITVFTAISGLAAASLAVPAAAGTTGAPGAAKEDLVGPRAVISCVRLTPAPGENISHSGPGFVVFNEDRTAHTVSANVVLKDARPRTRYVIRLIQSDGSDCFTVDATLTTNVHGNGEAMAVDHIDPGARAVNVIVDTRRKFKTPTYRAPHNYTLVRGSGKPSPRSDITGGATTASP